MTDPFDGLAKGPARAQGFLVRLSNDRLTVTELAMNESQRCIHVATVQPVNQSHGKEVFATVRLLDSKPELRNRFFCEASHRHFDQPIVFHGRLFERTRLELGQL